MSSTLSAFTLVVTATIASAQQGIQIDFSPAERQRLVSLAQGSGEILQRDYRKMAEMVFGHRMSADRATQRAWDQRKKKLSTHSGYWHARKQAEDASHLGPVWDRLKQDLHDNNRYAQGAMRDLMQRADQTGLSGSPRWGREHQRQIQRELDRLRPTPRVGDRPYTPLRVNARDKHPNGSWYDTTRAPVSSDYPNAPHILTGIADWWANQPDDVRKLTNQVLSEIEPAAQQKLLKELADDEITAQLKNRPTAHQSSDWHRNLPPPLRAAIGKQSPAMQQALRGGMDRLDRDGWSRLNDALGRMDYGGASGQAMLNTLKAKALPRSDSLGRRERSRAELIDGNTSFDNYARFLEPQSRALAKREQARAAKEAQDRRREFIDTLQRTEADPGLKERGQRYAKMWEVINRTPAEELAAFGKGFGKQGVDTVTGIANMVAHPIDTATGIYHLAQNPEMILVALDDASVDGDEFAGRLTFELALAAATAGPKTAPLSAADKARRASQMAKAAAEAGKLNRARRLAKLASGYAEDAVKQGLRDGSGARNAAEEAGKFLDEFGDAGKTGGRVADSTPGSYRGARGVLEGEAPGTGGTSKLDDLDPNATMVLEGEDAARLQAELRKIAERKADEAAKLDDARGGSKLDDASRFDELSRYDGPRGGPNDPVWKTPLGTAGDKVGDFSDITGLPLEDILSRIPKDAIEEAWKTVPGGAEHGRKFKWKDPTDGVTRRLRLHGPDPNPKIPPGNNAAEGWVARVQKGKQQFLDPADNTFKTASQMSDEVANRSHIPIELNPNGRPTTVVDPSRGPVSAKPADGLPPPSFRPATGNNPGGTSSLPASTPRPANRPRGPPAGGLGDDATKTLVNGLDNADYPIGSEVKVPRSDGSVTPGRVEGYTPDGDVRVSVPTANGRGTKVLAPRDLAPHNAAKFTPEGRYPVGSEVNVPRSDGSVSKGVVEAHTPDGVKVRVPTADGRSGTKVLPTDVLAAHNAARAPPSTPQSLFPVGQAVDVPRTGGGKTPGRVLEHYDNGNVKVGFDGKSKVLPADELTKANPGRVAQTGRVPEGYTRAVGDAQHLPDGAILPSKGGGPPVAIDKSHPALKSLLDTSSKIGKGWGSDLSKAKKLQKAIKTQMPDRLAEWKAFEAANGNKGAISLGDYLQQGCGVCKQNALATQMGLQEMGIPSRYVRGVVDKPGGTPGGHAWVEAQLGGKWYVLDNLWDHWNLMPVEQAYGRAGRTANGSRLVKGPETAATVLTPKR